MRYHNSMKKIHPMFPYYEIYDDGRIYSLLTNKFLKHHVSANNYLQVRLKNIYGKFIDILVHRLVAELFVPNPNNLPEVNHLDENPLNPHFKNLEWCNHKYNINYGNHIKKSCDTRMEIQYSWKTPILQYDLDGNLIKEWNSQKEAARAGYHQGNISDCVRGNRKTANGYIWKFKEVNE